MIQPIFNAAEGHGRDKNNSGSTALPAGTVKCTLPTRPEISYYLHVAADPRPQPPVMVAVHGINRQAGLQVTLFRDHIEAAGGVLVAPEFDERHFKGFQRLGGNEQGERADHALKRILSDVAGRTGLEICKIAMFGFSGGGQFVHRYAMTNPRQVERMAIAAPGWFTFPDTRRSFPMGIGSNQRLPDLVFDPARFLQIPTLVLVGEHDVERDPALRMKKSIDRQQGVNRVARGRKWVSEMSKAAAGYRYATEFRFKIVPGCGHSFEECMTRGRMGDAVVDFLFKKDRAASHFIKDVSIKN